MIIRLPIRSYSDIARLCYQFSEDGGNVLPLVEMLKSGEPGIGPAVRQIFSMLKSYPEFAISSYRPFVGAEIAQVVQAGVVDPTFPGRLDAGLVRAAHFMAPLSSRVAVPLNLLAIASSSPMEKVK